MLQCHYWEEADSATMLPVLFYTVISLVLTLMNRIKASLVHTFASLEFGVCVCVRTLTGLGMLVCSMDGTVAYLDFSLDELGDPLSEEEKV